MRADPFTGKEIGLDLGEMTLEQALLLISCISLLAISLPSFPLIYLIQTSVCQAPVPWSGLNQEISGVQIHKTDIGFVKGMGVGRGEIGVIKEDLSVEVPFKLNSED